jgi:outer membrane protein OmpA-like peptidoglycan-associated protein
MLRRGGVRVGGVVLGMLLAGCGANTGRTQQPVAASAPDSQVDTDRDGIADKDDACPGDAEDLNGYQDTDGCPDCRRVVNISMEEPLVFSTIYFADATAKLKPESLPLLDGNALLLQRYEDIHLVEVQGHAEPGEANGQALSDQRAEVVVAALVSRGIDRVLPPASADVVTSRLDDGHRPRV